LALYELLNEKPALVVSGINRGPNLADDMLYSGTVAGALEGAISGIPAMAVSLAASSAADYVPAAQFAARVARFMLNEPWPHRTALNVNVPDTGGAPVESYRWCRAGVRDYGHEIIRRQDPRGRDYFWLAGSGFGHVSVPGSDCDVVAEGHATLTPIQMDLTDYQLLETLEGVDLGV
jgi:5'-nucleotidase